MGTCFGKQHHHAHHRPRSERSERSEVKKYPKDGDHAENNQKEIKKDEDSATKPENKVDESAEKETKGEKPKVEETKSIKSGKKKQCTCTEGKSCSHKKTKPEATEAVANKETEDLSQEGTRSASSPGDKNYCPCKEEKETKGGKPKEEETKSIKSGKKEYCTCAEGKPCSDKKTKPEATEAVAEKETEDLPQEETRSVTTPGDKNYCPCKEAEKETKGGKPKEEETKSIKSGKKEYCTCAEGKPCSYKKNKPEAREAVAEKETKDLPQKETRSARTPRDKNYCPCKEVEDDLVDCKIELPSEIEEEASAAITKLLPQKFRQIYEKEYASFQRWRESRKIKGLNETLLLAYFNEKYKVVKPLSLWSYYSMLKATLLVHENCNISKFPKLVRFLKTMTVGYKPKKSKIFTPEEIIRFLKEAPSDTYLLIKTIAIMGLYGVCRSDELHKLKISNIDDRRSDIIISLMDTKNKKGSSFCITETEFRINSLEIIRSYIALRPAGVSHDKFFICYRGKKCTIQAGGINTIYKVPKVIAEFLKLKNPEMYTGHCFRRSSATLLANGGVDLVTVKRAGGWKSSSVAETYIEESISKKIEVSKQILVEGTASLSSSSKSENELIPFSIQHNSNCNVNIYINSKPTFTSPKS